MENAGYLQNLRGINVFNSKIYSKLVSRNNFRVFHGIVGIKCDNLMFRRTKVPVQ